MSATYLERLGARTRATGTVLCLGLAFLMLLVSPVAFWTMLWVSAILGALWVIVWAVCLVQAYRGRLWKLPVAGSFAERRAGLR